MSILERLAEGLSAVVARTGPLAPGVLFLGTFVEYVFPPFPGDLLVVLGSWYVVEGRISWAGAFASVMAGTVAGAWVDFRIGVALGRRADRGAARRGGLTKERLARFEASYRRWGGLLLVANRFFPGVRAFIFVAAGASGIPLRKVLLLGALSAALWNGALLFAGAALAKNAGELIRLVERYTHAAYAALAVAAIAAAAAYAIRRRRATRAPSAPEGP